MISRGKRKFSPLVLALLLSAPLASADEATPIDRYADVREGARIFLESCAPCHGLKYVRLLTLRDLGFTEDQIATMLPGSRFDTPLNSWIAPQDAETVFGLAPPDLSLITKARDEGADHVYKLLTSYQLDEDREVQNPWLPGTRMPDVLSYAVATDPDWKAQLEERAIRVSEFLEWASDPKADERRGMGYWVIAYLIVLTTLLYLIKRRVWADMH